jgi:hypothetical protein
VTNRQADLDKEFLLEQLRAASHRTTADRYQQLLAETTTPAPSEYLREMIIGCEA